MTTYTKQDTERLVDVFSVTYCSTWDRDDIARDKLVRFAQAYLTMARNGYRPQAPSDGFGNIQLTREELDEDGRLYQEAVEYAANFCRHEDADRKFWIGCSNYSTNRAFVLCIEAARLLVGGCEGDARAVKLLQIATKEIEANIERKV